MLEVSGREVTVTNPSKVYFPEAGITKLEVVQYYLAVAEGALRGAGGRPNVLVRYADGIDGEFFYQKRAAEKRPDWVEVAALRFPSGRQRRRGRAARRRRAGLDRQPRVPRAAPAPGAEGGPGSSRRAAGRSRSGARRGVAADRRGRARSAGVLDELGLVGWPKTSGSRGVHVNVRIDPRWSFDEVRRAALALAREVERRAPGLATSKWWKEERQGVFLDYNQNAKDRTVRERVLGAAQARCARLGAAAPGTSSSRAGPLDFTLRTMPARFAAIGDRHATIDDAPGSLEPLLELSARQEAEGLGDAPWPPHYTKQADEPPRVQPSREAGRVPDRPPRVEQAADRDRPGAKRRRTRWPGSSAGRRATPRPPPSSQPADVLVDSMRGRSSTWTRVRVNLEHVPEELRPPRSPSIRTTTPGAASARRPRRPSEPRRSADVSPPLRQKGDEPRAQRGVGLELVAFLPRTRKQRDSNDDDCCFEAPRNVRREGTLKTAAYAATSARAPVCSVQHRAPRRRARSDVAIEIQFCGVCHSDIHQARGEWGNSTYPDGAGPRDRRPRHRGRAPRSTRFKVGDLVGVGCFVDSCRSARSAPRRLEQFCEKGTALTYNGTEMDRKTPTYGGYSTQIVVDEDFVLEDPANLDPAGAAPLLCAGITTYSPLRQLERRARAIASASSASAASATWRSSSPPRWAPRSPCSAPRPRKEADARRPRRETRSRSTQDADGRRSSPGTLDLHPRHRLGAARLEPVPAAAAAATARWCSSACPPSRPSLDAFSLIWGSKRSRAP